MKLSDIMDEVEKYLIIDETKLSQESLTTGTIYGKILRIRTNESVRLSMSRNDLKSLYVQKRDYYAGRASVDVYQDKPFNYRLTKTEVEQYVESDSEIIKHLQQIEIQQEKVKYLDDALKMIAQRNFQIKSAIDYQKLINGA